MIILYKKHPVILRGSGVVRPRSVLAALALLYSCALCSSPVGAGEAGNDKMDGEIRGRLGPSAQEKKTPLDVDADHLDIDQERRVMTARGNVRIIRTGFLELRADQAQYRSADNQVEASGHIRLARMGDLFQGERVVFDMGEQRGSFEKVDIDLRGPGGLMTAKTAEYWREPGERSDGVDKEFLRLKDASFTNCDCKPPPWHLTSSDVEIDRSANRITAKDVRLYAGDVPVLALPWWRQPLLPQRESGFLTPSFRVAGNGLEAEVPYYWNIAPNRDATLALRAISRRGLMGNAQYRYLDKSLKGQLGLSGIYDTETEEYRGLAVVDHEQKWEQWKLQAHLEGSRSRDFIREFEQKLVDPRSRRLDSSLLANRMWTREQGYTNLQSGARWYQDLEQVDDARTVQNLPFVVLTDTRLVQGVPKSGGPLDPALGRWRLESEARLDNFYQMAGDLTQRMDIAPVLRMDRPLSVGHLGVALGARETAYLLKGDPNQTGLDRDDMLHRESALFAVRLDSTLRKQYGSSYLHTLEPSVQYVANAVSNQDKLPNYDSSLRSFTTTDIFAHNLYSGVDRISEAQWVGYSLTSRLLNQTETNSIWDRGVLTVGQRWAPEGSRDYQSGKPFSAIVSGLEVKVTDRLSATAMMGYNPYRDDVEYSDVVLSLDVGAAEKRKTARGTQTGWVRVGHHFSEPGALTGPVPTGLAGMPVMAGLPGLAGLPATAGLPASLQETSRERVEDLSLDASVRLSDEWIWSQKSDYSLESNGLKSWGTGLTYEHECWSLSVTGGRSLATTTDKQGGNFIGLFINLQGLGGVGI
ncbi:MAG: LPS assembly protein LptD [Magnetococcus sp. XQGC-1]